MVAPALQNGGEGVHPVKVKLVPAPVSGSLQIIKEKRTDRLASSQTRGWKAGSEIRAIAEIASQSDGRR